jgi:hypothetical protein
LFRTLCQQLEAESGIELEAPVVMQFRALVLEGSWQKAEPLLEQLDPVNEDDGLNDIKCVN